MSRGGGNARACATGKLLQRPTRRRTRRNAQACNALLGARALVRRAVGVTQAVAQRRRARASKRGDGPCVRWVCGIAQLVHRRWRIADILLHAKRVFGFTRRRRLYRRQRQPLAGFQVFCERHAEEKREGERGGAERGGKSCARSAPRSAPRARNAPRVHAGGPQWAARRKGAAARRRRRNSRAAHARAAAAARRLAVQRQRHRR